MNEIPAVSFRAVSRHFGAVRAVDDVSFEVADGEFFAMLGPSGSGKTTCLRLIAGFEQPNEGHIEIFGETAEGVPPYKRNVNTVFQDYALFPHMTVGENVAYGQPTPAAVMIAWMNSPGHRANILHPDWTHIGMGVAKATPYWAQVFLKR